jgi:pimeloyl-ACP methyl ester carboxylesterase
MSMLHHELVSASGATPERWFFVLHGVFGSGANWRLFTRGVAAQRPEIGFVLVDLRGHGRSPSMSAPHTLDAAGGDLLELERSLALPIAGVIGHSLGGKVALSFAAERPAKLEQVWLLDSQPGAHDDVEGGQTIEVLRLLESLPGRFSDRRAFTQLVEEAGHSGTVASWLAMSLRKEPDGQYRLGMDLSVIRALLEDHQRRDMWPELSRGDGPRTFVVVAGRSYVWRDADRERLEALRSPRLSVHRIEDAGHWLQVDDPAALASLLIGNL